MDGLVNQLPQNTRSFYDKTKVKYYDEIKRSFYYEDTEDFIMYGQLSYNEIDGKKVYNLDNIRIINEDGYSKPNQETRFLIGDGKTPSKDIKKEEREAFLQNMKEVICKGKMEKMKTDIQIKEEGQPKYKNAVEQNTYDSKEGEKGEEEPEEEKEGYVYNNYPDEYVSNEPPEKENIVDNTEPIKQSTKEIKTDITPIKSKSNKDRTSRQVSKLNEVKLIDSFKNAKEKYNNIDDINKIKEEIRIAINTIKTEELKKIFNNKLSKINAKFEKDINSFNNRLDEIIKDYTDDETFKNKYENEYDDINNQLFDFRNKYRIEYNKLLEELEAKVEAAEKEEAAKAKAKEEAEERAKAKEVEENIKAARTTLIKNNAKNLINKQQTREQEEKLNQKADKLKDLIEILKIIPGYQKMTDDEIKKNLTLKQVNLIKLQREKFSDEREKELNKYKNVLGKLNSGDPASANNITDAKEVLQNKLTKGGLTKKRQKKSKKKYIKIPSNMTKHKRFYQKIKTRKHK